MSNSQEMHDVSEPAAEVRVARWFLIFAAYLAALAVPAALLVQRLGIPWKQFYVLFDPEKTGAFILPWHQCLKLLLFAFYLSICCTFLPLPTNAIIAGISTQQMALTGELWSTALLVASVGAAASTMANLTDYHLFLLLLRHRRIGKVRDSAFGRKTIAWFNKSPFTLVTVANIVPIPVDVVRMIAATGAYPRLPFAAANYIGRFVRYFVLAAVFYVSGANAITASVIMLALAGTIGLARLAWARLRILLAGMD